MATSIRLIRRDDWLVETIRRAGHIPLDEISSCWLDNTSLNHDHEQGPPKRMFHLHREAVFDLFDIEIACGRAKNTYHIKDWTEIDCNPVRNSTDNHHRHYNVGCSVVNCIRDYLLQSPE